MTKRLANSGRKLLCSVIKLPAGVESTAYVQAEDLWNQNRQYLTILVKPVIRF